MINVLICCLLIHTFTLDLIAMDPQQAGLGYVNPVISEDEHEARTELSGNVS